LSVVSIIMLSMLVCGAKLRGNANNEMSNNALVFDSFAKAHIHMKVSNATAPCTGNLRECEPETETDSGLRAESKLLQAENGTATNTKAPSTGNVHDHDLLDNPPSQPTKPGPKKASTTPCTKDDLDCEPDDR